jgi:hypothetical protein
MKTLKVGLIMTFGLLVGACNDDDEMKSTNKLSSQEQAEMVAASMGKSGFAASADQSADYADDATASGKVAECGYAAENSVSLSGTIGQIAYSFAYDYEVALQCNSSEEPQKFTSEFSYEGSFDGPRLSTDHSGSGSLVITGLEEASANYTINGSYDRTGSFESKIENQSSGSYTVDVDADDVTINKSSKVITGGSADASISGVASGKGNYSFDSHIVFKGDGTATIKVSGDTYVMNLATGEVTAQVNN